MTTITISNIMHVSGTKADLYSPSYFKRVQGERKPVNPFTKWVNGRLFACGVVSDTETGDTYRVILDLTAAQTPCAITADSDDPMTEIETCLNKDVAIALLYSVSNPVVPPSKSYVAWIYSFQNKEHQFSNWTTDKDEEGQEIPYSGKWVATTEIEKQYLKDNEVMEPQLTEMQESFTPAEELKAYYYINKYDFPTDTWVSIDTFEGADLNSIRAALQADFEERYPKRITEIDVQIYEVDFTQADQIDTETEHDSSIMGYWLGKYEVYPKMFSVDQNENIIASYGNKDEPNMEGDFEYRHSLPDAVFDFKKEIVTRSTTLPICNGLCCYPRIVNGKLYASQGQRLSYNKEARDRRWILVDFNPVGGCTFTHLSDLDGTMSEMILPSYDATAQSVLLVVRGRLFLPGEFEIIGNRLLFDVTKFKAVYELDRKLCRGDLVWNSDVIPNSEATVTMNNTTVSEIVHVYQKTTDDVFKQYHYHITTDTEVDMTKTYYILKDDGEYRVAIQSDFDVYSSTWHFRSSTKYYELDTERVKYFVKFHDEFLEVDVDTYGLIGKEINIATKAYDVGVKDAKDNPVLFSTFYEYVEQVIYNPFTQHIDTTTKKETWTPNYDVTVSIHENRYDLKNDDNSFLIIINKPNLQVVRHQCYESTHPLSRMPRGIDSLAGMMKNDFDQQARGLLFDEVTRSVCDYSREVQTMTFYADKIRKWGISNISIHKQSLLAVTDESSHNLMSARGFVLSDVHSDKFDHVVWPRLSILDFIFRG